MHSGRFLSYSRKKKIIQNDYSLPHVVIRCHSLSFVVSRCLSLHHSLSLVIPLVVTRYITRLSLYKRSLKSKYLSSIRVFPFFISFFCWNEIKKKPSIKVSRRDGCRETFLAEVTGNSVSDHYARNICIKRCLKIAALWILERSKLLY